AEPLVPADSCDSRRLKEAADAASVSQVDDRLDKAATIGRTCGRAAGRSARANASGPLWCARLRVNKTVLRHVLVIGPAQRRYKAPAGLSLDKWWNGAMDGEGNSVDSAGRALTVGSLWHDVAGRRLGDELLDWAPDLFAFTDVVLDRSEAYRFAV